MKDFSIKEICDYVSNGGTLIDWCENKNEDFWSIQSYILEDAALKELYEHALSNRADWGSAEIYSILRGIAGLDIRDVFDESGQLLSPKKLSKDVARSIRSVKVTERKNKEGEIVRHFEYQFEPKMEALKMMSKNPEIFRKLRELDNDGDDDLSNILTLVNQRSQSS